MGRRTPRIAARGTSLVEAVVALAVMAFGMLAVVAVQSTLRLNADIAKQRSEAVRIAQEAIEEQRRFSVMEGPSAEPRSYDSIVTAAAENVVSTNTTYTLTRGVVTTDNPPAKAIRVAVAWTDRNGDPQGIELDTVVAGIDPRVSMLLGARPNGIPPLLPNGRSPRVPPAAVDIGGGRSAYRPSPTGAPLVVWLFDNLSGAITSVCTYAGTDVVTQVVLVTACLDEPSFLVSGHVRYEFGVSPDAANPGGTEIPIGMVALATAAGSVNGECLVAPMQSPPATSTAYSCRVRRGTSGWTGTIELASPLPLDQFDVCRYVSDAPGNAGHPRIYVNLDRSLGDQNFLVVDQDVPCPSGTQPHQPAP
jgi:Tfp pilus assembly protein PilV